MLSDVRGHRWSHSERLVNPHEIVVQVVKRNRVHVILNPWLRSASTTIVKDTPVCAMMSEAVENRGLVTDS